MPILMCDIDGVLRDFDSSWKRVWRIEFGEEPIVINPYLWNRPRQAAMAIGLPDGIGERLVLEDWGLRVMSEAEPYPGAIRTLKIARQNGWRIVLASHQYNSSIQEGTLSWLYYWSVPYDLLVWTDNKCVVQADAYVEDKAETLEALSRRYPGKPVYRVMQQWNLYTGYHASNLFGIKTLSELVPLFGGL